MPTRRATYPLLAIGVLLFITLFGLWTDDTISAQTIVVTNTPAVVLTNTPAPTPTPLISSTLVVATPVEESVTVNLCENPLQISVGAVAYLRPGTTIRYQATDSSAWMGYNTESVTVEILEGPICNENRIWWRVDGLGLENPGWVKEFVPNYGYFVIPAQGELPQTCNAETTLAIGRPAEVYLNTRIRSAPGLDAPTLTVVSAGESVLVLDGAECADGWRWWFVQATVLDITYQGWMAETFYERTLLADVDVTTLDDTSLCGQPLAFEIGQRAYVSYNQGPPKYLRDAPGTSGTPMFSLVRNIPFVIVDGPVCRGELNWWKIKVLASTEVIGWMAEGSGSIGYWMQPLDPFEYGYELPLPPTALANP